MRDAAHIGIVGIALGKETAFEVVGVEDGQRFGGGGLSKNDRRP